MAHYAHTLKEENAALRATIVNAADALYEIRNYLLSEKFQGTDADGERKDYVNVRDILNRLDEISQNVLTD